MVRAVNNSGFDDLIFPDNAVARCLNELDSPLPLAFVTGDQRVQWRIKSKRSRRPWNVVRVTVGDDDRATNSVGRHIGERAPQSTEQLGPFGFGLVTGGFDDSQIDVSKRLEPCLKLVARFICLLRPLADALALRTIDDQRNNVLERTASFLNEIGITKGNQQEGHAQPAQPCATNAAPDECG